MSRRLLTADVVLAARRRYRTGEAKVPQLAKEAGVTTGAMYCAITGRSWSHLPDALGWGVGGRRFKDRARK